MRGKRPNITKIGQVRLEHGLWRAPRCYIPAGYLAVPAAEFALSYRAVSLHSSAIAVGIILVGLLGVRDQKSGIRYQS